MSINQRIKQIRHELNLSQAKFAKELSISNSYIAGIELENRNVNDRILKLVCMTFNVNEDWLRTGNGDMFNRELNHMAELALSKFKDLTPEFQDYIVKQISLLLEMQMKDQE